MLRMRPKCLLFRATVVVARGDDLRFRRVQACVVEGAWNHSKFLEVVKVGVVTEVAVVCRGGGCCWCCLQPLLAATAAAVPVDTSSDCGSLLLLVVLKVSCQGRQKNLTGLWSQCSHTWCSSMFVASPLPRPSCRPHRRRCRHRPRLRFLLFLLRRRSSSLALAISNIVKGQGPVCETSFVDGLYLNRKDFPGTSTSNA